MPVEHFFAQHAGYVTVLIVLAAALIVGLIVRASDSSSQNFPEMNNDRILVEPIEVATTVRGMERPGAAAERPKEGIARWVGPGKVTEYGELIEPSVQPGDLLSFPDYAGKEVVDPRGLPPGAYLVVRQDEVLINYGPAEKWLTATPITTEENHE